MPALVVVPALFFGEIPASLEGLTAQAPWQEARTPGADLAENGEINENISRYYPWNAFIGQAAASHELPLWNPYESLGAPFFSLWRTRVLSPFSIPFYLFPTGYALCLSLFLKFLVAGICAYAVARRFGYSRPFSLMIAVMIQTSAALFLQRMAPVSDAVVWFPVLLWYAYRMLLGEYRVWPLLALVFVLMGFGGSPETLVAAFLFLIVLLPVYRIRLRRMEYLAGAYVGLFAAGLLAAALLAVQIFPYVEYCHEALFPMEDGREAFSPAALFALLLPRARIGVGASVEPLSCLYIGAPVLLMTALWFSLRQHAGKPRRRRLESLALATLLFALIPVFFGRFFWPAPGWSWPRMENFLLPLPLLCAFFAAAAGEEWLSLDADACKSTLRRFGVLLVLILAGGAALFYGVGGRTGLSLSRNASTFAGLGAGALAVLFMVLFTMLRPSHRIFGYVLTVIMGITGAWAMMPDVPSTPTTRVFPDTAFITSLRKADTRVAGTAALKQWPLMAQSIPQLYNPSGVTLKRYQQFMQCVLANPTATRLASAGALLLTRQDIQGTYAALRPALNIQEVFSSGAILLKDLKALPRARMVYAGRKVSQFDPSLLSVDGPAQLEGGDLPEKDDGPVAVPTVSTPEKFNRVSVSVKGTRPGMLVLADAYYPGWIARVDGVIAPVVAVDGMFRGVELGEGDHEVTFEYRPLSLRLGLYTSAAGLVVLLAALNPLRRKRLPA